MYKAIYRIDDARLASILESWFVSLVNKSPGTPTGEARWRVGFDFVSSTVTWLSKSSALGHDVTLQLSTSSFLIRTA
jgi:hypothetical protein